MIPYSRASLNYDICLVREERGQWDFDEIYCHWISVFYWQSCCKKATKEPFICAKVWSCSCLGKIYEFSSKSGISILTFRLSKDHSFSLFFNWNIADVRMIGLNLCHSHLSLDMLIYLWLQFMTNWFLFLWGTFIYFLHIYTGKFSISFLRINEKRTKLDHLCWLNW